MEAARADDLVDPWFTAGASWLQALFGWAWSRPGPAEVSFVVTSAGLVLNTVESWQHEALRAAGIDPAAWDPARGLAANDASVQAAWELYARLYADNPDQFLWAGMATELLEGATGNPRPKCSPIPGPLPSTAVLPYQQLKPAGDRSPAASSMPVGKGSCGGNGKDEHLRAWRHIASGDTRRVQKATSGCCATSRTRSSGTTTTPSATTARPPGC